MQSFVCEPRMSSSAITHGDDARRRVWRGDADRETTYPWHVSASANKRVGKTIEAISAKLLCKQSFILSLSHPSPSPKLLSVETSCLTQARQSFRAPEYTCTGNPSNAMLVLIVRHSDGFHGV
jgi:hypothetical protein